MLIKNIFIRHDRFEETYGAIERAHYPVVGGNPDYGCMSVIAGESRAGKTYAAQKYAQKYPLKTGDTGLIRPVIYVDIPIEGQRALLEAVADALGHRYSQRVNTAGLQLQILNALAHQQVELLVFDEVNTIVNSSNKRGITYALSFFRKILNHCKLNIVCIGLQETYDLLAGDPQLTGRGGLPCYNVHPYSWESVEERLLFRLLCDEFDKCLPFVESSSLQNEWFAQRLFYSSKGGNIGRLKNFLYSAGCRAINDNADHIEVRHFAEAYEQIKGPGIEFNPWVHDLSLAPKEVAADRRQDKVRFSKKAA